MGKEEVSMEEKKNEAQYNGECESDEYTSGGGLVEGKENKSEEKQSQIYRFQD